MRLNNARDLGLYVRDRRRRLGLTQAGLAASAQVSRRWLSDLEAGKPTAEVGLVFKVLHALDLALANEIGALRRLRDRDLASNALGRALVRAYYAVGPALADAIRPHDAVRALTRAVLSPLIALARMLDDAD